MVTAPSTKHSTFFGSVLTWSKLKELLGCSRRGHEVQVGLERCPKTTHKRSKRMGFSAYLSQHHASSLHVVCTLTQTLTHSGSARLISRIAPGYITFLACELWRCCSVLLTTVVSLSACSHAYLHNTIRHFETSSAAEGDKSSLFRTHLTNVLHNFFCLGGRRADGFAIWPTGVMPTLYLNTPHPSMFFFFVITFNSIITAGISGASQSTKPLHIILLLIDKEWCMAVSGCNNLTENITWAHYFLCHCVLIRRIHGEHFCSRLLCVCVTYRLSK